MVYLPIVVAVLAIVAAVPFPGVILVPLPSVPISVRSLFATMDVSTTRVLRKEKSGKWKCISCDTTSYVLLT
jgi:hypothetical protein